MTIQALISNPGTSHLSICLNLVALVDCEIIRTQAKPRSHIDNTLASLIVQGVQVFKLRMNYGEPVGSVWIGWESCREQVGTSCCDDHLQDKTGNLSTDMPNKAKQGQLPLTPNTSAPLPQGNAFVAQTEKKSQGLRKSEVDKTGCSG